MPDPVTLGVDVGGTKMLAVPIDARGEPLGQRRESTVVGDGDGLVDRIADLASDLAPGRPIGVGIAGIVDHAGAVAYGPNLHLEGVPFGAMLAERCGTPVHVLNDATAALYGEYVAGAAAAVDDVVMLTLGTGVGGAVVSGGRLVLGAHGMAGELGHVIVEEGGRPCPCGNRGCIEAYASGTAIGALARERLEAGATSVLSGRDDVDGRAVTAAAVEGDAFAREVLTHTGEWLGVALAGLVNIFDPEVILLGGGAATHTAGWIVPAAAAAMRTRIMGGDHRPVPAIVLAQLGDEAGALGAALYARDQGD